jgi:hypothetical protein
VRVSSFTGGIAVLFSILEFSLMCDQQVNGFVKDKDSTPIPPKWILVAREEFARFKAENPDTLTDIQRAVRFYYLLKAGYGAKVVGQTFNIGPTRPSSFNLLRIEEELSEAHLRLSRVYIENMHYQRLIERFDRRRRSSISICPTMGMRMTMGREYSRRRISQGFGMCWRGFRGGSSCRSMMFRRSENCSETASSRRLLQTTRCQGHIGKRGWLSC